MMSAPVSEDSSITADRDLHPRRDSSTRPVVPADVDAWVEPAKSTNCWFFTSVFAAMMFLLHASLLVSQPNMGKATKAGNRGNDTFGWGRTWFFVYVGVLLGFLILMCLAAVNLKNAPIWMCLRALSVSLCWLVTFLATGVLTFLIRIPNSTNGYKELFAIWLLFAGVVSVAVAMGILCLALVLKQQTKNLVCVEPQVPLSPQVGVPLTVKSGFELSV